MKIEVTNKRRVTQELLPQIVERIFAICKNDPNFALKDELEIVENKSAFLKQKISKQDELLKKSNILKGDLIQRLEILEAQNEKKQIELLESIGSEL